VIILQQEARDRIDEARATARAIALAKLSRPARPDTAGRIRLMRGALVRALTRVLGRPSGFGKPRAATKRC
jgi:hypothetical protein